MIFPWECRLSGRSLTPDPVPAIFTWLKKKKIQRKFPLKRKETKSEIEFVIAWRFAPSVCLKKTDS